MGIPSSQSPGAKIQPSFTLLINFPAAPINAATPCPALHSSLHHTGPRRHHPGPHNKVFPQISLQMGLSRLSTARKASAASSTPPSASLLPGHKTSSTTNCSIYPLPVSMRKKKFTERLGWVQIKNSPSLSHFFLKLQNNIT